ncbi:hypothetical protein jhhlp_007284 [Lomentospora prolificans]|uniref:SGNH hydrolase-type esterase domain-containing protein n=1 Tax=Lomentospora prolificans TaxID=41688 RepID=A0A2N3N276_9PEZI|nr:hypothetical protein jhhlp_007284 [Lomentospora prolificans]
MPGLKVLCFGDSLTSGYYSFGLGEHPYAETLVQRLRAALPAHLLPVSVKAEGRSCERLRTIGVLTSSQMRIHMTGPSSLAVQSNDIAYCFTATEIYSALKETWAIPLSKGTKVLALTVPECKSKAQFATDTRNNLNKLILRHKEPNFYAFDLHAHIPYHSLSPEEVEKYWDDGLHLTEEGYDWMGGHIADALIKLILTEKPKATAAPKPERKRRGPRVYGDEGSLEEEAGDPKKLSAGYVVVRQRDLE